MAAILIVEDRPLDREFLVVLLKSAGHTVTEASDGAEGLRLACDTRPDLIISDILMPTVDGFEFVRRMREIHTLARTPVIFYTAAYHAREARVLALQCGADILTKPSDYATILARIDAALESVRTPPTPIRDPAQFSRDHLQVVASALESKIQDFDASEHRMTAIVGFAQQIAAEHEADALLAKVCEAAREVTLAQDCVVTMLGDDRSVFRRVAACGIDDDLLEQMKVPGVDGPAFRRAIADRRTVRMENPEGRPAALGLPDDHPLTYSFLVVPIASPSLVYGCLSLRNKLGAEHFSDRDEEVALTLATHAGIAYENAQRYDRLRQRSAALEQEVAERRRVEARTQLALTASQMGVWELDLAADRLEWSDSMAAIFGLSPAQAPTTRAGFAAVIHPEDRDAALDSVDRAIREKTDIANEFRTIWPDGTVHWIAGHARLVTDQEGNATRVIGVGMDIGERKSLEEQLRQGHKMEAIGQLAGGVAHDFNNLLTVIHGYADLVLATMTTEDARRADVDEIVKAASRAAGLTRQLLAFSRKQVLQPTLVDVNSLVGNTCGMLRRLIGEHVELVTNLAGDLDSVYADAGQLEQILMNLAINARDAMPQGGRLSIETAAVALDDSSAMHHADVKPGSYVMLAVVDNGTGMDEQTQERIFEPFFTTKERGRGTGLGLATVYGIVRQSGGYISVETRPGCGATFRVFLPRAGAPLVGDSPVAGFEPAPTGSETLLLVEDEEAVRFLSRALLERAGYHVLDAADPQQAEDVFRQHADAIDLLVTDVIMPGSSGPSLFARLSAERPSLKVLYMSGYADESMVHASTLIPKGEFLQKPFTAEALMYKVREALDR
jgi:PAS domain S-box-containing protein